MKNKIVGKVNRFFDGILNVTATLAGLLIVFQMLSICWEVIMRYFFNSPSIWVVELAAYSALLIPFLGAPWILKKGGHVKMDLLLDFVAIKNRNRINLMSSFVAAVICLILTYYGVVNVVDLYQSGFRTQTVLMLPKWPIMSVIPLSMCLLFFEFMRRVFGDIGT